jgi:protein arginine kinase activator
MEQLPERHIECSECKRPIVTCYTEVVGKTVYRLSMCAICPVLKNRLHGTPLHEPSLVGVSTSELCCGNCGTTAGAIRMGSLVGCGTCYEIFENLLIQELSAAERALYKVQGAKRPAPLHLGKVPGQPLHMNPAQHLLSLHQALGETLRREDYEQAAWLRDQIKALTEETKDNEEK